MIVFNKKDMFLLEEIVKKNFISKYKDSVLGIFWSVLNPLLTMALFTILFSTIFGRSIENYPIYFLCGRCVFDFFKAAIGSSLTVIKGNKNILQRTAAPKYIFVLGTIVSEFFNFFITLILLGLIMIVTRAPFHWTLLISFIPIVALVLMITGLSLMLSIICVYYTDVQHLWSVLSLMMMYASAIFYPMDMVPEPYRQYLILNPLYWVIDQFRCFVYYGTIPAMVYMLNLQVLSLIILVLGVIVFKKYERNVTMNF